MIVPRSKRRSPLLQLTVWVATAGMLTLSCSGGDTDTAEDSGDASEEEPADEGSEEAEPEGEVETRLAELEQAAQDEGGSLEYYFVLGEDYLAPMVDTFRERYPWAEVNITSGGTLQLIERVITENETNNPEADLIQGGPLEDQPLCYDRDLCMDYDPIGASVAPDELRFADAPFVVPAYFTFHVAYNTDVVDADELPTTLEGFAEPEWRGRFGIDVEVIDGFAAEMAYYGEEEGTEIFEALAANDPVTYAGAQGYEQLAAGALPVSINAISLFLPEYIDQGAPIAVAEMDHVIALPDEFIAIESTDSPELLKLFLEWLFTDEAQQVQADALGKTPVSADVQLPETLASLTEWCTNDCELFFGTSENFGDFDARVAQFEELFVQ